MELEWDILKRAGTAPALSGILGWERQAAGKSAGARTHMHGLEWVKDRIEGRKHHLPQP